MTSQVVAPGQRRGNSAAQEWLLNNTVRNPLRVVGVLVLVYLAYLAYRNVFVLQNYTAEEFFNQLITGAANGSIYALIALGYTLVYGILFMINFAHGEIFMAGAYIGFFSINAFDEAGWLTTSSGVGWALLLTMLTSVLASVIVAVLLERIAYRPLRNAPRLVPLITAIGASIAIQQLFLRLFGAGTRTYPVVSWHTPWLFPGAETEEINGQTVNLGVDLINGRYPFEIGGIELRVRPMYILVFIISVLLMAALSLFIQRTKLGRAMRAVAEDRNAAALMGVNVNTVIVTTFVLGAALAGAAATLYALYNRQVSPFMGFNPGLKAFTSAVLGGIGNVPGAMVGGLLLGILEQVGPSALGLDNQLKEAIAFGVLVLILVLRPNGLFGGGLTQKRA